MVRTILIGAILLLMAISAVILYCGLVDALREDNCPENLPKRIADSKMECDRIFEEDAQLNILSNHGIVRP